MISSTSGSSISGSSGPSPTVPDTTLSTSSARSLSSSGSASSVSRAAMRHRRTPGSVAATSKRASSTRRRRRTRATSSTVLNFPARTQRSIRGPGAGCLRGARGTTRTSRAKLSAAVNSTAWRSVARSVTRPSAARLSSPSDPGRAGFESDHRHSLECQKGAGRGAPAVGRDQHVHLRTCTQHL